MSMEYYQFIPRKIKNSFIAWKISWNFRYPSFAEIHASCYVNSSSKNPNAVQSSEVRIG